MFFTGGFIYLLYRSLTLRMFSWLKSLGLYQTVLSWRESSRFILYRIGSFTVCLTAYGCVLISC